MSGPKSPALPSEGSQIVFMNRQRKRRLNLSLLRTIAVAALGELPGIAEWDLAFYFVGEKSMAALNEAQLEHSGPTDVITFDYGEGEALGRKRLLHGEIFVCIDVALEQAREYGTTWQSEVVRYLVHGLLHLYGHDDLAPVPRRAMKQVENRLVRTLERRFAFTGLGRV